MNSLTPSFSFNRSYNEVFPWLRKELSAAGLRLLQTFDLSGARIGAAGCPCPHHETEQCDCEMIVLLIYGKSPEPATLILHGNHGQTWLSLVNNAEQSVDPGMQSAIAQALQLSLPK